MVRDLLSSTFVLSLLALAGCSQAPVQQSLVPVFPVEGSLTYQGAPMTGAVISFVPAKKGLIKGSGRPTAVADDSGKYRLTTFSSNDGAPEGEYKVVIYWPEVLKKPAEPDGPMAPDRLKEAYAKDDTTKLTAKVASQGANTIDFKLP